MSYTDRIRCNQCGVKGCQFYQNLKIARTCKIFQNLESFKTPLLLHLLGDDKKVESTTEVLEAFNIRVFETTRYPYFRLGEIR